MTKWVLEKAIECRYGQTQENSPKIQFKKSSFELNWLFQTIICFAKKYTYKYTKKKF